MIILRLALKSLLNRLALVTLTTLCIALSVGLVVGVEKVRDGARASFAGTVSGVDLIVGARSGNVQLMLYAVFRIGDAANNLTWETYSAIAERPDVDWIIPLSLGDSHRGYRVVGTDQSYFEHFRYRDDQSLRFGAGAPFDDLFDVVLGATVAEDLGYEIGDVLVVNHGLGSIGLAEHGDLHFRVSGILERTGTPVDKALHVSLSAIEAIHVDWQSGGVPVGERTEADALRAMDLTPRSVTAALVKLTSPIATFTAQRDLNQYREEPISAVIPGLALLELWSVVEIVEAALRLVAALMVVAALAGMIATLLALLNDRRREIAILRAVGAGPWHVAGLLVSEATLIGTTGALLGVVAVYASMALAAPWIEGTFGLALDVAAPGSVDWLIVLEVAATSAVAGLVPAYFAYGKSLADGIAVQS